jgi:His-Xaa-Ser system radical SAM maturase HxsC
MITLRGKVTQMQGEATGLAERVLRVTKIHDLEPLSPTKSALLLSNDLPANDHAAYLFVERDGAHVERFRDLKPLIVLPAEYSYLDEGDLVVLVPQQQRIRVLYRRASKQNYFLTTERCNHYCLMCSQPPKDISDDWLIDEIQQAIPLIDTSAEELGFTGGEPTLLGERFLAVLRACKQHLPNTVLHVLSNGRRFADPEFAKAWAAIAHPDLMVGIPVYSDVSSIHDYVVQADGAFDETIRGILNLKRLGQQVEIRVVLHKQTFQRLPQLAEFISRNLLFVDHVALMGLEITGFTRANMDALWIDPVKYQEQLRSAVETLNRYRVRVSIYNLQLCLLDRRMWKFAVKSISDWKNEYFEECSACDVQSDCGGFFASAKLKRSEHIRAIRA